MVVKVGDKIKCKEDTMDLFLKSGEIAYVADIVYGVSHPYYVVKDKSLIGTSHWDLNPNTYTLLIPDEIELLEKFDGLDIVEIVTKNGTYYVELNYDDFVEVILDYEWHVFENIVDVIEHSAVDYTYVESRPSSRGKLLLRTGDIISVSKLMRSKNV